MAREWEVVEAFGQMVVVVIPKEASIYITGLVIHSHLVE